MQGKVDCWGKQGGEGFAGEGAVSEVFAREGDGGGTGSIQVED